MTYPKIGSISSGTLRTGDLLEAFADELEYLRCRGCARNAAHVNELCRLVDEARAVDPESEEADELVSELIDALNELAPPYVYFGAHVDDGADFGFWPDIDSLEDAARYGEVEKVNDLSELTRDVMLVNDHGNVTYGYLDSDGFHEVWSCV